MTFRFGFLEADNIGVGVEEVIFEALVEGGAHAVDVPGRELHESRHFPVTCQIVEGQVWSLTRWSAGCGKAVFGYWPRLTSAQKAVSEEIGDRSLWVGLLNRDGTGLRGLFDWQYHSEYAVCQIGG